MHNIRPAGQIRPAVIFYSNFCTVFLVCNNFLPTTVILITFCLLKRFGPQGPKFILCSSLTKQIPCLSFVKWDSQAFIYSTVCHFLDWQIWVGDPCFSSILKIIHWLNLKNVMVCLFILTQHKSHAYKNNAWKYIKESIMIGQSKS